MTSPIRPFIVILAALPLAACMQDSSTTREADIRAPQARVVGEPVNCVAVNRIDSTDVHDDYTIDFEMLGNTVYRNTLPNRCSGLGFAQRFGYDLRGTTQLCSTDVIHVLDSDGRQIGTCGLGQFVPVEITDAR
jgi:hypothetical protein